MQSRLGSVTPDADGLKQFLLLHYGFESGQSEQLDFGFLDDREAYDEDYEEEDDDDEDTEAEQQEKRQQLRRTIDLAIERLQSDPNEARQIYNRMWSACDNDLMQLQDIQDLLADEFIKDHKREQVTAKVRELVSQGRKILLISTFSDTVLDYYRYMTQDLTIVGQGIGMAIGGTKRYFPDSDSRAVQVAPHNVVKAGRQRTGIKRLELFRLFAPAASCRNPGVGVASPLGASIYGDTLFDDTILPGYVDFIRNLVATRRQTQESFQETLYRQQETSRDLYTQQEIIFSEDIR
jgi:hypothetical protein